MGDQVGEGAEVEVSVIIPVAQRDYGLLRRQLHQLGHQKTSRHFEVLVADNTGALDEPDGCRVVPAWQQAGAAFARNSAVDQARGQVLLFCDADDLVCEDWVERHAQALTTARVTVGSVLKVDQHDELFSQCLTGSWPSADLFTAAPARHEGIAFATTANCGIDRRLFVEIGGFELQFRRSEDVALSLAARERGEEVMFVPKAQVVRVVDKRTRMEECRVQYRAGGDAVRLSRRFAVGPRPSAIVSRAAARTVRSVMRRQVLKSSAQLTGAFRETLRRSRWSARPERRAAVQRRT